MKIAIVGSGIAGLTAAHLLHAEHEITVFEAGAHWVGRVHTHDVESWRVARHAVDTGFIVFNDRTYPHFIRFSPTLGVERQASDMSFCVTVPHSGLEYNGNSLNALFAQRANLLSPGFWGMLRDILRFNREAPATAWQPTDEPTSAWATTWRASGYGATFRDYYILPMGAAIWSTDAERMLNFPLAVSSCVFFKNHGLLSVTDRPRWRVIQGGSRNYVEPLIAALRNECIRLNCPVLGARAPR